MRVFIVVLLVVLALATAAVIVAGAATVAAVVLPASRGYVQAGELQTETRHIDAGDARAVAAEFRMGCGTVSIRGGAADVMDAKFGYNVPSWRPEVVYAVTGGQGKLSVKQPPTHGSIRGHAENWWDIRLGGSTPVDLTVDTGLGKSTLDLDGVNLTALKIDSGTGGSTTRLTGSYPSFRKIDIDSGVGRVSLDLVGDYPALTSVDIDGGTGDLKMDLTGEWTRSARISVDGGVGKTTLRLPRDVGVRVAVDTGIGKVRGSGMRMDGSAFVNDAYGRSKVTLDISAHTGTGDILLSLE